MNLFNAYAALRSWMAERELRQAVGEFTCSNCEHCAQCGREPSDDCIHKLQQIARGDDWRYRSAAQPVDWRAIS